VNQIIAMIPRESLESVRTALLGLDVGGVTLSEIFEPGHGIGTNDEWWSLEPEGMLRLEVISLPEQVEAMARAIAEQVNATARRPRGMIFIAQLEGVVRVRTEQTGTAAIR